MIPAIEIGLRAAQTLAAGPGGKVVGEHDGVAHLMCDDGKMLVVIEPSFGWGPLNIVVPPTVVRQIRRGTRFSTAGGGLIIGEVALMTKDLPIRDCRPEWHALAQAMRTSPSVRLADACHYLAQAWSQSRYPGLKQVIGRLGAAVLEAAGHSDAQTLEPALRDICGYGPGLTPAGDDWLMGWLLGARLSVPDCADTFGRLVLRVADGRTTRLSLSYLRCAAAGETDALWSALLSAIAGRMRTPDATMTIRNALARGASSGVAAMSGFLSALDGLRSPNRLIQEEILCLS